MQLTFSLLEALVESWLTTETPRDIGMDPEKIQLLKAVRDSVTGDVTPAPFVVEVYREVFLRDVWTKRRERTARGTALAVPG